MSLFQHTVIKKQIASHAEKIQQAYKLYAAYFLNPDIQENIRNSKEEQFQEGFLRELFVKILGYTLNPDPDYNLITEKKNETNSKKADGAILVNGEVRGVIELKDHKTTDLKQVETQAFGYKNYNAHANYVVISNFEKLRFYIDTAVEFEEFNLFTLTENDFAVLWMCLAYENIARDLPKQLKNESSNNEDQITKKLYKDYSTFKQALFADIMANKGASTLVGVASPLELFRKTQKLLDRFLFIFFAEDKGLLPPNSMKRIIDQWDKRNDDPLNEYQPLYSRLKLYFKYMDEGHKGKAEDIFGYNGGLFKTDSLLDELIIDDAVLKDNILKMIVYDFDTEVDVNILGHIFEHSLSEIESVGADLRVCPNTDTHTGAPQPNKRKKDGVFYTPRYITKYIVENTLGKLCADKKAEMGITNLPSFENLEGLHSKKEKKQFADKLDNYREWLLALTICDPACGSGAFLNAALDFLMSEHRLIDEMTAKLFGNAIVFPNIENAILENNLYGVDINEESVEIARLSLWLRTAKPQRKLNSLNNNIKCGNSLISPQPSMTETNPKDSHVYSNDATYTTFDPEGVAQTQSSNDFINIRPVGSNNAFDKAFDWHKEFPQVFEKGGFDVVIGNPPYLVIKGGRWVGGFEYNEDSIGYIKNRYKTAEQQINTYILFLELAKYLTKANGIISQITPNTFFANEYSQKIRLFLIEECNLLEIKNSGIVFDDASVETAITTYSNSIYLEKTKIINKDSSLELNFNELKRLTDDNKYLVNIKGNATEILMKLQRIDKLSDVAKVWRGLTTGNDKKYLSDEKSDDTYKPLITGTEVQRYFKCEYKQYVNYIPQELDRPRDERIFLLEEKLISKFVGNKLTFCFDNKKSYVLNSACSLELLDNEFSIKYLLTLLNSNLLNYYFHMIYSDSRTTFPIMKSGNIESLPIPKISLSDQQPFITLADKMLSLNTDLQTKRQRFLKRLTDNFSGIKITGTLEHFDELEFAPFLAELKKQKISLSYKQQDDLVDFFEEYKKECRNFVKQIEATDKEIDGMVYALYGLTEEEVRIIEDNNR
jgi:hypothetical protein